MLTKYSRTNTAKYFMRLYRESTIERAAELAAQKERESTGLFAGFEDYSELPIDVTNIASQRNMHFSQNLDLSTNEDARAIFSADGTEVQLNSQKAYLRQRFTIAHEIGHELFCRQGKHQIGLMNRTEMEAEDKICQMFASALLMPPAHIQKFLQRLPDDSPWAILSALDEASRQFQVSLQALIRRMGWIDLPNSPDCMVLYLMYKKNYFSDTDPQLRIQTCSSLGRLRNVRTWYNRTAKGINLQSAVTTFDEWQKRLENISDTSVGKYTLDTKEKITRATSESLCWKSENVKLSVFERGRWGVRVIPMLAASCLYAMPNQPSFDAYIISILKPMEQQFVLATT